MVNLIGVWFFLSSGSFHKDILPPILQYFMIVASIIFIMYMYKINKRSLITYPFIMMMGWVIFSFVIKFINDGVDFLSVEKLIVYACMIVGYITIACNFTPEKFIENVMYGCLAVLGVSIIFAIVFPYWGVEQDKFFGSWRGIFDQKNALGRVTTISVFCASYLYCLCKNSRQKSLYLAIIIFSFIVCYYTGSRTSLAISVAIVVISLFLWKVLRIEKYNVNLVARIIFILFFTLVFFMFMFFAYSETYGLHSGMDGVTIFGKNISLTGRLTIWFYAVSNTFQEHFFTGYGMDNFWTVKNYNYFGGMIGMGGFYPHDSHNGLVDLFVQTGCIGTLIYMTIMLTPLFTWRRKKVEINCVLMFLYMLIFFIFTNLTESYVTKSTNVINGMMLICWFRVTLPRKFLKN